MGSGGERGERGRKGGIIRRLAFWNVAGLSNKDKGGGKEMGYDGMDGDMGGGERMGQNPKKIAERYRWGMQLAKREGKRGMVMGIRKDILVKGGKINEIKQRAWWLEK